MRVSVTPEKYEKFVVRNALVDSPYPKAVKEVDTCVKWPSTHCCPEVCLVLPCGPGEPGGL